MGRMIQIRSGGQTGVDRGALYAALHYEPSERIEVFVGGYVPKGLKAEDGSVPDDVGKHLIATKSADYRVRTRMNVEESDGTVICITAPEQISTGTLLTINRCIEANKPFVVVDVSEPEDNVAAFIVEWTRNAFDEGADLDINFAGPRESKVPGIQELTRAIVDQFLCELDISTDYD